MSPPPTSRLRTFDTSAPRAFSGLQSPLYAPAWQPKGRGITSSSPAYAECKPVAHMWRELRAGGDSGSEGCGWQSWPACLVGKDQAFKTQTSGAAIKIPQMSPFFSSARDVSPGPLTAHPGLCPPHPGDASPTRFLDLRSCLSGRRKAELSREDFHPGWGLTRKPLQSLPLSPGP